MLDKKWCILEFDKSKVIEIADTFKISPLTAIVMYNRGIRENAEIEKFLAKDFKDLHDQIGRAHV